MLIFKTAEESAQQTQSTSFRKTVVDADIFLGIIKEGFEDKKPYHQEKSEFAEIFNVMSPKDQKHFDEGLKLFKAKYPITNFLDEKVDKQGLPYYFLKIDKFGGAKVEVKIVLNDAIRKLINDVHDGKVIVNFTLDDLKAAFGQ